MPKKISEPQELLINKLKAGASLRHETGTGLFRLQDGSKVRTVHPATVESLIREGVISKSMGGDCRLAKSALPSKSLTVKQLAALQEAGKDKIFQLPERRRHSPGVLAALVKAGLLKAASVGVIWTITDAGRAALENAQEPNAPGTTRNQDPNKCPSCGSPAKFEHGGRRWRVLCSRNTNTLHSACDRAGHVMFTKTEAVRVWNELK